MNTLGKKSCLALCLLCAAHFVAAQDSGGSDVDLEKLSETVNVLQGAQDPELTLQSVRKEAGTPSGVYDGVNVRRRAPRFVC